MAKTVSIGGAASCNRFRISDFNVEFLHKLTPFNSSNAENGQYWTLVRIYDHHHIKSNSRGKNIAFFIDVIFKAITP